MSIHTTIMPPAPPLLRPKAPAETTFVSDGDTDPDLQVPSASTTLVAEQSPSWPELLLIIGTRATGLALSLGGLLAAVWITMVFMTTVYRMLPTNDFGRLYHSTVAYWKAEPMYGWNPTIPGYMLDQHTLDGEEHIVDLLNLNPPHFHLVFLPLALLPVETAFGLWILFGLLAVRLSVRLTLHDLGAKWTPRARQLAWFVFLGSAVTTVMVSIGQIGWVLLLPVTLMWLAARRGQWVRCGLWLGLLVSVKPFFLIFLPYFLLKGNWRVLLAAVGSALGIVAISLPIFGAENYWDWLATLAPADSWAWLEMNGSLWGMLARCLSYSFPYTPAADMPLGDIKLLWLVIGGLMGLLTLAAAWGDRSAERLDRAFALLLVGAVLFSPLGWIYYFPLPFGPLAALVITWRRQTAGAHTNWSRWRGFLLCFALVGLFWPVAWTHWMQPSPLATFTLGSLYFWITFVVWLVLILDGLPHVRVRLPRRRVQCHFTATAC